MKTKRLAFPLFLGLVLTLAVLGALAIPGVLAADIGVTIFTDGGVGSLREAISTANSNGEDDTITLPAGTYTLTITGTEEDNNNTGDLDITSSDALTITGAGAGQTIINAGGIDRVFDIRGSGVVVISGVTVYSGSITRDIGGGGIRVWNADANLTLSNSVISDSKALFDITGGVGGGILVQGGDVTLLDSQIINNESDQDGGGIYIGPSGHVLLDGARVIQNTMHFTRSGTAGGASGGGIHVRGVLSVTGDTLVSANDARVIKYGLLAFGGGVGVEEGGQVIWNAGVISGNTVYNVVVADDSDGVYIDGGSFALNGGEVINHYGQGVVLSGYDPVTFTQGAGGRISDNDIGIRVEINDVGTVVLKGEISHNQSLGVGLGVGSGATLHATLDGARIINNSATANSGGGVVAGEDTSLWEGKHIYLTIVGGTVISDNQAEYGGGLTMQGYVTATIGEALFINNRAAMNGGAIYVNENHSAFTITNATVISNAAGQYGGGVYVSESSATLTGTHILDNSASTDGGGLYLDSSGSITATNGCIINNTDTGVFLADVAEGTLSAQDNWWGAADGPGGAGYGSGDTVNTGVDYANFKTVAPASCVPQVAPKIIVYLPLVIKNN
ncbi:MAG: hypothetical protein GY832_32960 [Chloroflexi bacterium]|nr:hypothetical protein [Chloroflexota bacterium]